VFFRACDAASQLLAFPHLCHSTQPYPEDVNSAIDNQILTRTAGNISGFAVPNLTISNPPTQAEVQQIADILHDLLIAFQRGP
jgi:hypothetical protein